MKKVQIIIAVLVAVVVIEGGLLYFHKTKSTPASTTQPTTSQHAGWKTYTLRYEKLSFSYPQNWQLKDTSSGGSDMVTLSGTKSFTANIQTGVTSHPSLDKTSTIVYSEPATMAGQAVYFDFLSAPQDNSLVSQVYISISSTDATTAFPALNTKGLIIAHAGYSGAASSGEKLADTAKDQNYLDAKSVIASMRY